MFTPVGVTFRGGGFYKTDSRNGKSKSTVDDHHRLVIVVVIGEQVR